MEGVLGEDRQAAAVHVAKEGTYASVSSHPLHSPSRRAEGDQRFCSHLLQECGGLLGLWPVSLALEGGHCLDCPQAATGGRHGTGSPQQCAVFALDQGAAVHHEGDPSWPLQAPAWAES